MCNCCGWTTGAHTCKHLHTMYVLMSQCSKLGMRGQYVEVYIHTGMPLRTSAAMYNVPCSCDHPVHDVSRVLDTAGLVDPQAAHVSRRKLLSQSWMRLQNGVYRGKAAVLRHQRHGLGTPQTHACKCTMPAHVSALASVVNAHQGRLWFIKDGRQQAWYVQGHWLEPVRHATRQQSYDVNSSRKRSSS